jgi:hypothetical protein
MVSYDNLKEMIGMDVVADKLELQSLLLEKDVFYKGKILSADMKKPFFQLH